MRPAPAVFIGWQKSPNPSKPSLALYNMVADIPGHPTNSTVSGQTLREAGYEPPTPTWKER